MPALQWRIRSIVAALSKVGHEVEVVQGYRSFEYQQALWEQGRTRKGPRVTNAKAGQSWHNYGLAADFAPVVNGKIAWPDKHPVWEEIGRRAKRVNLEWGGDWKTPDRPHVELSPIPIIRAYALYKQGGISVVWAEVERSLTK